MRGFTTTKAKGYGEYANFYTRDWMTDEGKIEVFVARNQVESIAYADPGRSSHRIAG